MLEARLGRTWRWPVRWCDGPRYSASLDVDRNLQVSCHTDRTLNCFYLGGLTIGMKITTLGIYAWPSTCLCPEIIIHCEAPTPLLYLRSQYLELKVSKMLFLYSVQRHWCVMNLTERFWSGHVRLLLEHHLAKKNARVLSVDSQPGFWVLQWK